MTMISRRRLLQGAAAISIPGVRAARAQDTDPAAARIQDFYEALTAMMKSGGTAKSRYEKLKPAVDKAFDLPAMTATAVGPGWAAIPAADQKTLIEAFGRMTAANYAKNFDSYHGEKFIVEPQSIARGADRFVKSSLTSPGQAPIAFNYRMHQADGDWRVTDVYLAGNISQMAQKRSDFAATLSQGGAEGLTKSINALTDRMLS